MMIYMKEVHDVIIIGAGAVGCAVARELSRYSIRTLVLEKECDVAYGTSGRMSGVVHAGFNNKTGSLMAKLCVEGNRGFEAICRELDIPYKKTGKVLVAFDDADMKALEGIIERGKANGCEGLKLLGKDEIEKLVPGIGGIGGMLSPNTAIFDPFEFCIAHAENAMDNGVEFRFDSEVTAIRKDGDVFEVRTPGGTYYSRYIVNSDCTVIKSPPCSESMAIGSTRAADSTTSWTRWPTGFWISRHIPCPKRESADWAFT